MLLLQSGGLINLFRIQEPANYVDSQVVNDSRNIQMITDIFIFIIPVVVIAFLVSKARLKYLQITTKINGKMLLLGALTILVSLPVINYLGVLNQHIQLPDYLQDMEQKADAIEAAFEAHHTLFDLIMNIIVMALVAAVSEELFFRAGMQKIMIKLTMNVHIGVWVSAIIFSAIHMQFSGFFPRMLLGVFLGYLFVWSGSIWVNIFAHFMFNGSQIFVQYLQDMKISNGFVDKVFSPTPSYTYIAISTVLVVLLIVAIYRMAPKPIVVAAGEIPGVISE